MRINLNNKTHLEIEIRSDLNSIMLYLFDDKENLIQGRRIDELEIVDIWNLVTFAQDNGKNISDLWEVI